MRAPLVHSILVALILLPVTAQADGTCEIHVGAVIASNTGRIFDPRLEKHRHQFDSLFQYSSYRLLKEERRNVQWGSRAGFDLPGGRYLLVIPREYKNDKVSFKLMLIDGQRALVDTGMALKNEGTFLVGGPRDKEGVLIIAVGMRNAE